MSTCKLVAADGTEFEVATEVATQAGLVKEMIGESDDDELEIPLPNVSKEILTKVVEFLQFHHVTPMKEILKPLRSPNMEDIADEYDVKFISVENEVIFQYLLAANYMDIQGLLDLCCAKLASYIKGRTPEEIKKNFGVEKEFTEEDKKKLLREYPFLNTEAN